MAHRERLRGYQRLAELEQRHRRGSALCRRHCSYRHDGRLSAICLLGSCPHAVRAAAFSRGWSRYGDVQW